MQESLDDLAQRPRHERGPYGELDREDWARLAGQLAVPFTDDVIDALRGLGDPVDATEVREVYLPLSRLLSMYVAASGILHDATNEFLGGLSSKTPYVIGVAGSVAVGKSTTARVLRELLAAWPAHPKVTLVTTDGFLLPNAELERRGILQRKGFPESYDQRALLRFVVDVKSGNDRVTAPVYSHLRYDIVLGAETVVERPDILIVEGLNVLQPGRLRADGRPGLAVSDFFDFSVYVDARTEDIKRWYVERFLGLRETTFSDPSSYFHRYAGLTDEQARETAIGIWDSINERNLVDNVVTTRGRANLVLSKDEDHSVRRVRLRKL